MSEDERAERRVAQLQLVFSYSWPGEEIETWKNAFKTSMVIGLDSVHAYKALPWY